MSSGGASTSASGMFQSLLDSTAGIAEHSVEASAFEPSTLVLFKPSLLFKVSAEKIDRATFYKVEVEVLEGQETGSKLEAWRRKADFEWLRGELVADFPSVVVPPIPISSSGRLSSRDRDLEAYGLKMFLEKVADNLVLRRSEKLRHFLEDNTEMFHEVLEQSKAVAESRKRSFKSGFMRGLKKFGSLFRKKQEGDVSRLTEPESEAVDYASSVKKSLNKIFKRTAALAQAQSKMGMCMEEVAASIKAFDVYEPQSVLKSMWKQTEECICTTSNAVEAAALSLDSTLGDFALYERANHQCFIDFVKTRSSAQVDHEAECKELATAVADRGKAKNAKKQATLDTEIERLEKVVDFHEQRFRGVVDSMPREYRRLISDKAVMLANCLQACMGQQLHSAQKIIDAVGTPLRSIRTMELPAYTPVAMFRSPYTSGGAGGASSSASSSSAAAAGGSGKEAPYIPRAAPPVARRPPSPSRAGPPAPASIDPDQAALRITSGPSAARPQPAPEPTTI